MRCETRTASFNPRPGARHRPAHAAKFLSSNPSGFLFGVFSAFFLIGGSFSPSGIVVLNSLIFGPVREPPLPLQVQHLSGHHPRLDERGDAEDGYDAGEECEGVPGGHTGRARWSCTRNSNASPCSRCSASRSLSWLGLSRRISTIGVRPTRSRMPAAGRSSGGRLDMA